MANNDGRVDILMVEDNANDEALTLHELAKYHLTNRVQVVRDGQEALDYLYGERAFSDAAKYPAPDLILLDLNLPKRDGREVLRIIKQDSSLKEIPVVVVSTSDREEDISYAFQTGAVAYISKSSGFDKFNSDIASVARYARVS